MPSVIIKPTEGVPVDCGSAGAVVSNDGPSTVYYRDEFPIGTSPDGSIVAGSSVELTGTQYFTVGAESASLRVLPNAVSSENSVTLETTVAFEQTSPMGVAHLTGEFVPERDAVTVDIDISHAYLQPLLFQANWDMYWAQADGNNVLPSPLIPVGQNDAFQPGVTRTRLGALGGYAGGAGAKGLRLTGLVPGRRVSIALSSGVVGGMYETPTTGTPEAIACSKAVGAGLASGVPASTYVVMRTSAPHEVIVHRCQPDGTVKAIGTLTLPTTTYGEIAIQPSATADNKLKFASVSLDDHSVTVGVIDLTTQAVTLQAKYTVPGTTPSPYGVAIDPTGTYAWIGCLTTNRVYRMALADGTFSAAINPGFTSVSLVAVSPDGASVYVTGTKLGKINASDLSVGPSVTLATLGGIAVSPDSATVYALSGTNLVRVRASDMAVQATQATQSTAQRLAIFPDGLSAWLASQSAGNPFHSQHYKLPGMTYFVGTQDGNGSTIVGVAIDDNGNIFLARKAAKKLRWFTGGRIYFSTAAFWGHTLRGCFAPAHAA